MEQLKIKDKITLEIVGLGHSGEGVGNYQGYTIFVDGALPGESVEIILTECRKTYGRADLIQVVKASPHRVEPVCPLFGTCGGCQLMHLDYSQQLIIKQKRVSDALQRIGKIYDVDVAPCLPSPSELHYRNKIQLPLQPGADGVLIGLYARASHDIVEVDTCYIHCDLGEEIYKKVREIIRRSNISAFDPHTGEGELRHILIKTSITLKEVLVILVTTKAHSPILSKVAEQIMQCSPFVKGVVHNINTINSNIILGYTYHVLAGSRSIQEQIGDLKFNISPASFFQVNTKQAERLYAKALEWSHLTGNETVLDAYCGVGTISLFFAKHAKHVIGIECVPTAIEDAKENAKLNGIKNTEFICANVEDYIRSLKTVDVMILNPPRKGCEKSFLDGIKRLRPSTIVYISCDPATLARDLAFLCTIGYKVNTVQPYDMFPQTAHVECVVKLSKL